MEMKYKLPSEGNQVKVTFKQGKKKEVRVIYCVLDKNGDIDVKATEARIQHVADTAIDLGPVVEEVVEVEEIVEEVVELEDEPDFDYGSDADESE